MSKAFLDVYFLYFCQLRSSISENQWKALPAAKVWRLPRAAIHTSGCVLLFFYLL